MVLIIGASGQPPGACDEVVLSPDLIDHNGLIKTLQDFFSRAVSPVE